MGVKGPALPRFVKMLNKMAKIELDKDVEPRELCAKAIQIFDEMSASRPQELWKTAEANAGAGRKMSKKKRLEIKKKQEKEKKNKKEKAVEKDDDDDDDDEDEDDGLCPLCKKVIEGYGNNGRPLVEAKVCDTCMPPR